MITLNIMLRDIGFRDSPIGVSFIRMYGKPGWAITIGRDNGILYETAGNGRNIQFPLSPDAWSYNLAWSRYRTAQPDPCLLLTEKPLLLYMEPRQENKYAKTRNRNQFGQPVDQSHQPTDDG